MNPIRKNRNLMTSSIQLFIALIMIFSNSPALAQWEVRPELQWKVLHSEHFDIIHTTAQRDLAVLYAEKLESAHKELRPFFSEAPAKISVVINDKTDLTNGYATRIPYPHIFAYPVLPGPEESLGDTGDWAFELLAHEYTHILNMEPAGGVMKSLRSVFGTIISPNMLLPTWWKEGLAVEMETRLGHHGRLRSVYQDATLRAMVKENLLFSFDLAQANEFMPTWPQGMRPYLFGSLMWSQMIADHGAKVVDELNQHHGRRAPYFVESPAHEHLHRSYSAMYNRTLEETSERALKQINKLNQTHPTDLQILPLSEQNTSAPTISADGKHLALITEDDSRMRSIKIITKKDSQKSFAQSLLESESNSNIDTIEKFDQNQSQPSSSDESLSGNIQRVSWFPDSTRLVFDKVEYVNRFESFSDLHVFDLKTRKSERLGKGLRGREPAVSLDGKSLIFIKLSAGKTELAQMKLEDPSYPVQILFSAPLEERLSYPSYLNAKEIVFSWRRLQGEEHLYRYSLETGKIDPLLQDYPDARFARMTRDGLIFNSSKNGTQNIYLAAAGYKYARPITHTLTAFYMSDQDPLNKDLIATTMTSGGFKVASISKKDWVHTPPQLPKIGPMMADRYSVTKPEKAIDESNAPVSDYSSVGYLWPQYWIPFVGASTSQSGIVLQATTSGFDPLKKHTYNLTAFWDTGLNKASLEGLYLNQTMTVPFTFSAIERNSYLGDITNPVSDILVETSALPSTFSLSRFSGLQLGWVHFERTTSGHSMMRTGPFAMMTYQNYKQSGAQISPESGMGAYLGLYNFIPQRDYLHHSQFLIGGEKYFSSFLPKHHAFMLRMKGAYTPENISPLYGVSTDSLIFIPDNPLPEYILRGYQRGQIIGTNLVNVNIEYRFPLMNIYKGSGTDPFFLRRISAAITGDSVSADGYFLNTDQRIAEPIKLNRSFYSAGLEGHLETTIGYVFPLTFVFGYYQAFNTPKGIESSVGTSIQLSGF